MHPKMDMGWDDVRLFLAVAESGSVSAAARQLRIGQPTVSRRLAELEDELGYPLFRRSHHGAALTTRAERLLEPAKKMAEWAAEISRASRAEGRVEGTVRVAAPPGVAFEFVAPFAAWLAQKHPGIRIEALSSVHYVDLTRGDADLAIRMRPPASKDLVAVCSLAHENAAFTTREYAKRLKKGYGMAEIDWIVWAPPYEQLPPNPQLEAAIPDFKPAFSSDNFLVNLRAAEAGLGAMVLGRVAHRFSRQNGLVPLKLDLGPWSKSAMHLVCARTALDIPRVRLVADLMKEELERMRPL